MADRNIFRVGYEWYEGEKDYRLLVKEVSRDEFESDLIEARDFARSLIGKYVDSGDYCGIGYSSECLPQFFHQVIFFLIEKKGYLDAHYGQSIEYYIDDDYDFKKVGVKRLEKRSEWITLGIE